MQLSFLPVPSNNKLPEMACYQISVEEVLIVDGSFSSNGHWKVRQPNKATIPKLSSTNFKVAGSVSLELSFRPSPVLLAPVPVKIRSQYYGGTVDLFMYK